jgi:hypothetical protein
MVDSIDSTNTPPEVSEPPQQARIIVFGAWPAGENTVKTPGQRMNANQTHPSWGVGYGAERGAPVRQVRVRRFETESVNMTQ